MCLPFIVREQIKVLAQDSCEIPAPKTEKEEKILGRGRGTGAKVTTALYVGPAAVWLDTTPGPLEDHPRALRRAIRVVRD